MTGGNVASGCWWVGQGGTVLSMLRKKFILREIVLSELHRVMFTKILRQNNAKRASMPVWCVAWRNVY